MGSPLRPSLTNSFLAYYEQNWLDRWNIDHYIIDVMLMIYSYFSMLFKFSLCWNRPFTIETETDRTRKYHS